MTRNHKKHLYELFFPDDEMGLGSIQRHSNSVHNILPGSETICIFKTSVTFYCFNIKIDFIVISLPVSRGLLVPFRIFRLFSNLD